MAATHSDPRTKGDGIDSMTLLSDVITIPEAVHKGDFVMSLASWRGRRAGTLDSYVVTPQLADAFKNALGFIASAVTERQEQGGISRRQLRIGQVAFHGGAAPAPPAGSRTRARSPSSARRSPPVTARCSKCCDSRSSRFT